MGSFVLIKIHEQRFRRNIANENQAVRIDATEDGRLRHQLLRADEKCWFLINIPAKDGQQVGTGAESSNLREQVVCPL